MPAYNFKSIFADAVESGLKYTTIRKPRKNPTKPGDTLYLYTGLRTKQARLLRTEKCVSVTPFSFLENDVFMLDKRVLSVEEMHKLAKIDTAGLWSLSMLMNFFYDNYGLPFVGELIMWEVVMRFSR